MGRTSIPWNSLGAVLAFLTMAAPGHGELPTDNVTYPVLIEWEGIANQGSGFFLLHGEDTFLVTAKHVDRNQDGKPWGSRMHLLAHGMGVERAEMTRFSIDAAGLRSAGEARIHPDRDVAIYRVGVAAGTGQKRAIRYLPEVQILSGGRITVVDSRNAARMHSLRFTARVYVTGYPNSLGLPGNKQIDRRLPLIREGIIAGANHTKSQLILDCRVDRGNSGAPVLMAREHSDGEKTFWVVGVVSQFVPYAKPLVDVRNGDVAVDVSNSGYSVVTPMDAVMELLADFKTSKAGAMR